MFRASSKSRAVLFLANQKHCLEHARWTFRASRKSNSAKVIFYCKANKTIFTKQLSCAAQITQGAYTDVAFWFHPKRLSLRTQDKTLTLIFFWKSRNPYTPSEIRFSNGLAYNRSKVSVTFAQIGFIYVNFLSSQFLYLSNDYENG